MKVYFEADTEAELQKSLDEINVALGYPTNIGFTKGSLSVTAKIVTEKYGEIHPYKTKKGKPITACFEEHAPYFEKYGLKKISWDDVDVPVDPMDELII